MRPSATALTRLALKTAREKGLLITEGKSVPVRDGLAVGKRAAQAVQDLCRERSWPVPVTEHYFALPDRKWRFDLAWPDLKLAIEFQGGIQSRGRHVRPRGYMADCEKYCTAVAMGWRVMPVAYPFLKNGKLESWLKLVLHTSWPTPCSPTTAAIATS